MTPVPTSTAGPVRAGPRLRGLVTGATVVALAFHVWALYRDHGPPNPRWLPHADKVEHLVGFGLPCFLVLLALQLRAAGGGRVVGNQTVALVAVLFVVHAGVSEVLQGEFYTTRTGDPYDALADVVGTALGVLGYLAVRRRIAGRARGRG